DDQNARGLIQRVLDAGFLDHTERLPHRMMDVKSCLDWGEFKHEFPTLDLLYNSSILGQVPSPLFLNEDAIYALTHVVMFLYGFGTRKQTSIPVEQYDEFRLNLSVLLVIMCQEHHWDLLSELLLCWECVGYASTDIYERAWKALLSVQNADGAIPGP